MATILLIGWRKGLKAHTETCGKIFLLSFLPLLVLSNVLLEMVRLRIFRKINGG